MEVCPGPREPPAAPCSHANGLKSVAAWTGYDPRVRVAATCALIGAVILVACGRGTGPTSGTTRSTEVEAARLRAADGVDGTTDRVVSKCAVCKLAMDGTTEHSSRFEGYELHFCSPECKETFDHDPHAVLRRLHAPQR